MFITEITPIRSTVSKTAARILTMLTWVRTVGFGCPIAPVNELLYPILKVNESMRGFEI